MLKAFRGEILHFLADPAKVDLTKSYQYFDDGILLIENGKVLKVDDAKTILTQLPNDIDITHYPHELIMPGFIDTHIHYPQADMIAAYGEQLLEWLENYTFPTENLFDDYEHASDVSEFFLNQLLDAGTTTALVFGTVHKASVDAFFTKAQQKGLRMICGKVLMDRNAPDYLTDTADSGFADSQSLIEKWHKVDRLLYAVTPRFAPTSSREQLDKASELLTLYPDVYMHTHLSENTNEIAWVQELFPESNSYLNVYDQSKLLGRRSVFAHGVHLADSDCLRLSETQSAISFCPCSNLFLGSGLFNLKQAETFDVNVGLGTDIGAGTSFSLLTNMNEAYKIQQLKGNQLSPFKSFYLATLGGAVSLDLDDKIGNFETNKEADFIVLDYHSTALMKRRISHCKTLFEKLFVLSTLGDDRTVTATYILGDKAKIT